MWAIHWTSFRQGAYVFLHLDGAVVVMIYHKSGCFMNKIYRYCNYTNLHQESLMICSWIGHKNSTYRAAIITYIDFDMRCFRNSNGYIVFVRAPFSASLERIDANIGLEKYDHRETCSPYSCGSNVDYLHFFCWL